jgi:L-2-hydroxyglutarate oxidase LhgO
MQTNADYLVVGSGIVGLAVAWHLSRLGKVVVVDKEPVAAFHQTGRNSGVVHSGVYYVPGSLKAIMCTDGRRRLLKFCSDHDIPVRASGKLILAVGQSETSALDGLATRGEENGLSGLERLSPTETVRIEPAARPGESLLVPETGLVDYHEVAKALAIEITDAGGELLYGFEVASISADGNPTVVATDGREVTAERAVNCAGLQSDRLARMSGAIPQIQIIPFRGIYYSVAARGLVARPIYPVPDMRLPFLGVHLTPTVWGGLEAGPNAVLATGREAYRFRDLDWRDLGETIRYPGFRQLARTYWKVGATEVFRTMSRKAFAAAARRLVPGLEDSWLIPAGSGIRAQAVDRGGNLVDDFVFERTGAFLHVLNAPSPAATASLAIGAYIADLIDDGSIPDSRMTSAP